jgi:cation:H+ antiporter
MSMALFALGLLAGGTVLLLVGADWFVDGAPALAVGNVLGTNITMVTAALGLSALIFPMTINRCVRRQAVLATLVSILPIVLLLLGIVTQLEGVLLLVIFVGYTLFLLRTDQEAVKRLAAEEADDEDEEDQERHGRPRLSWKPVLLTFGGLAAMAVGGPALVEGALRLTHTIGLSQGAIGATIVSLGTGAEMIALGVRAARKHRSDLLVGGILGSFAYNLLVTLGLAATIHVLQVDSQVTWLALLIMVGLHLGLLALVWYGKIPRVLGGLLVAVYMAYLIAVVVA